MESLFLALPGFLALLVSALLLWRLNAIASSQPGESRERIAQAQREAQELVRDAQKHAQDILRQTEQFRDRMTDEFEKSTKAFYASETDRLSKAAAQLSIEYQNLAEEARGAYVRVLDDVTKSVSLEARRAVSEFQNFVRIEMARYERLTDQGLEEWRRTLQSEIEKKREAALKRIEESVYRILFFVSKEVLGHALDLEEHQALVIRALEDAKRQGFFDL
jgi:uncharacterized protein YukE